MNSVQIDAVILCDMIRQENNGKYILIGVYGENIQFLSFPASFAMSLYVLWTPKKLGKLQFELQIVGAHEAIIAKANVLLDAKKEIRSAAALGPLVLNFQSAGTIKFQLKEPNGQWESILEIPASQAVLPSSPIVVIPSPSTPTH